MAALDQLRTIVFFGDSRADWWLTPDLPGARCVTCGIPGASSDYLLRRFKGMVAPLRPEVVVVQMGANDLAWLGPGRHDQARAVAAARAAIAATVAQARELGARVVLTTVFPLARGPLPDAAVQRAIAEVNRDLLALAAPAVQVLDSAAALAGPDGYVREAFAEDELHLSAAGYAALNAALVPLLG